MALLGTANDLASRPVQYGPLALSITFKLGAAADVSLFLSFTQVHRGTLRHHYCLECDVTVTVTRLLGKPDRTKSA